MSFFIFIFFAHWVLSCFRWASHGTLFHWNSHRQGCGERSDVDILPLLLFLWIDSMKTLGIPIGSLTSNSSKMNSFFSLRRFPKIPIRLLRSACSRSPRCNPTGILPLAPLRGILLSWLCKIPKRKVIKFLPTGWCFRVCKICNVITRFHSTRPQRQWSWKTEMGRSASCLLIRNVWPTLSTSILKFCLVSTHLVCLVRKWWPFALSKGHNSWTLIKSKNRESELSRGAPVFISNWLKLSIHFALSPAVE